MYVQSHFKFLHQTCGKFVVGLQPEASPFTRVETCDTSNTDFTAFQFAYMAI